MKSLLTIACAALLLSATPTTNDGPKPENAAKKGWVKLFDGKTKKGWHIYNNEGTGESWKVADGVLYCDVDNEKKPGVKKGGDLTTDLEYENYHLSLEWKISEGGNSGIIFGVHEDPKFKTSYATGMEMQVLDNEKAGDAKNPRHRAGDLYDLIKCNRETVKPAMEWNHAEIIYVNSALTLKLNGETVVTTTVGDEQFNQLVAGSKFKTWPGFAKYRKGKISLQDHGNLVWFRNIKIKQL
jgi:hypothetical protein